MKNRNYWKYLKAKLRKEQSEVVSDTTQLKLCVDWSKIDKGEYIDAMIATHISDNSKIRELLRQALTDRIEDCEIFMKGIDYSYYYEQED